MSALERHLSIPEISELWNLSPGAVRKIFRDRGDVLHLGTSETRSKRGYLTLRVPESVVVRVHDELKKRRVR
jgi:hypothetical protein